MQKIEIFFCILYRFALVTANHNQMSKSKSYMDLLPEDLLNHIDHINQAKIIRNAWKIYLIKKRVSLVLLNILVALPEINAMSRYTGDVLAYCLKFVTIHGDYDLYNLLLLKLDYAVVIDEYTGGQGAVYYNRVEELYQQYVKILLKIRRLRNL